MGDFSDDFLFVDDVFYGDGTADETTQPLDVLLENLIESDTRWVVRHRHLAPYNFAGEDRIYASPEAMAIAYTPIYLDPSTDVVSVDVAATITSSEREAAGTGTSTIEVRLRMPGVAQDTTQWTGDGTLQNYTHSVTVGADAQGWALLLLEIKSEDDGQELSKTVFDDTGGGSYFLKQAASGGDDLSEGDYLILPGSQTGFLFPIGEVDFRYDHPTSSGTTETGWPMLSGRPDLYQDVTQDQNREVAKHALTYIKPRTIHFSVDAVDDRETQNYTPKPDAEMYANIAVLGSHTSKHQRNIAGVYERQELKAVGPQMEEPTQATWGNKWRRWPVVEADGGADQPLCDLSFMLDRDTSTITAACWMHFVHLLKGYDSLSAGSTLGGSPEDTLRRSGASATKMDWSLTAKVLQASGADWSTATEIATTTVDLEAERHWLAYFSSKVPILQQIWYSYFHQDIDGKEHYMWYEGGLLPNREDLKTLVPVTISMDVSKVDMDDFDRPVRLQILASPDKTTLDYRVSTGERNSDLISARMITCAVAEAGKI